MPKKQQKRGWIRLVDNKMKDYGEINYSTKIIRVNKKKSKSRRGGVLDTIVHEELHRLYPLLAEKEIRSLTAATIQHLNRTTKQMFYNRFRGA